jgi:hypothetical protein
MSVPLFPSIDQIIEHRLHEHTHIVPRMSRNYQRQKYVLGLKDDTRGRFRGITNMGQQVYGDADNTYGLNPSVANATRTLRASSALTRCMPSKWVQASPSDECTILSGLYLLPFLCHVICFVDSSVMYSRWILGMKGRYCRTFVGIFSYSFLASLVSTSRYLEDFHFGQCVAPS